MKLGPGLVLSLLSIGRVKGICPLERSIHHSVMPVGVHTHTTVDPPRRDRRNPILRFGCWLGDLMIK